MREMSDFSKWSVFKTWKKYSSEFDISVCMYDIMYMYVVLLMTFEYELDFVFK